MALELKQSLKLSQQLVMTPQLQQAIKLLQLSRIELVDLVNKEMLENPLLEEGAELAAPAEEGDTRLASAEAQAETPPEAPEIDAPVKEVEPERKEFDHFEWENYIGSDNNRSSLPSTYEAPDELPTLDVTASKPTTLHDHLRWQMQMSDFTLREESVGNLLIGDISEDGYFEGALDDIGQKTGYPLEFVEDCLMRIQEFDPPGVGARDLEECLLIQSRLMENSPFLALVRKVIKSHIKLLMTRNYPALAKALGVSQEKVHIIVKLIGEMEPKPGRPFSTENPNYITPDIYVYKVGADYTIVLNDDGLPRLRISKYYQDALSQDSSSQTKEYIQGKIRSAIWFIKSLHQRQRTVYKTTESIVKHQRDFFDKGIGFLKPMILRDVAEDISMHESTISRVTTNKYVHTPHGIFELKFFFNSSISRHNNEESVASESVKNKIKQLISSENPKKPFSDQQLVEILSETGIVIARRTVAKYREALGMLSSSKRKRLF